MLTNVNWGGVKWKPISLKTLFRFTKGNQNHMSSLCNGAIPLVSARKVENGYKGFITPNNKELFEGNIITLNLDGDGGAGIAYYQPSKMALDSHVCALSPRKKMTRHQMLFISRCITNQGDMFGHGYSINGNRIKSIKIILPVDDGDEINWDLMDKYMKGVECTQIMSYLEYAKSQLTRKDS